MKVITDAVLRDIEARCGCEVRTLPLRPGYAVSADGQVWSINYGHLVSMLTRMTRGRLRVKTRVDGYLIETDAARLILEGFEGWRDRVVEHKDGDVMNLRRENLRYGDAEQKRVRHPAAPPAPSRARSHRPHGVRRN